MSTPARQPIGVPLQDLGPSSSFLQQLLEEINRTGNPHVLRDRRTPAGTPRSRPGTDARRRAPSLWVGGGAIAQEARERLRAADETRLRKSSLKGDGTMSGPVRPSLHLQTSCFDPPSSASGKSTPSPTLQDSAFPDLQQSIENIHEIVSPPSSSTEATDANARSCLRTSSIHSTHFPATNLATSTDSPLMFCDSDSDGLSTPSPSEAPTETLTEAVSTTLTNATSMADDRHRPAMNFRSLSDTAQANGSNKRAYELAGSPGKLSKKMRTVTFPQNFGTCPIDHLESRTSSWRRSIGGDNTSLLLSCSFTERTPASVGYTNTLGADLLPDLSSFRPQAADSQGLALKPMTRARTPSRRPSVVGYSDCLEEPETPIYARSLHLIDGHDSIYKKDHGDEWRENSLCLYCFRLHGKFSKLSNHGCESCGHDEPLESHYWEENA